MISLIVHYNPLVRTTTLSLAPSLCCAHSCQTDKASNRQILEGNHRNRKKNRQKILIS